MASLAVSSVESDQEPLINANPTLQRYYGSLESRAGYRLILGGTRHFGYYKNDTYWPWTITGALRAMEDHLFSTLDLPSGSRVLDAGCGVGHVAIHLAKRGLRIDGIDVVDRHIARARRNIQSQGMSDVISVRKADYHHLECFAPDTFDGVYTMETLFHATDLKAAVSQFFKVLKPGGRLALYEYDYKSLDNAPKQWKASMETIRQFAATSEHAGFDQEGVMEEMLHDVGFVDVQIEDLTRNITPLLRLFCVLAFIPYLFVKLFALERWFINTVAAVDAYTYRSYGRYIVVSARKPDGDGQGETGLRKRDG